MTAEYECGSCGAFIDRKIADSGDLYHDPDEDCRAVRTIPPLRTPVILRRWRRAEGGGVIALFPELPADYDGYQVTAYEHVGQHGGADYATVMRLSEPVAPGRDIDAEDLLDELRSRGYDPIIRQRRTYAMLKRCIAAAREPSRIDA